MRKIWNRSALPVWSLSTQSSAGIGNMNICTYVTAVSMDPKLFTIAVYKGTQTYSNVEVGSTVLLQLLTESLAPTVLVCGQLSGAKIDKIKRLQKRYELNQQNDLYYFVSAAGYIELNITDVHDVGGDHLLVTGRMVINKNLCDEPILTTTYLKEHNYTR